MNELQNIRNYIIDLFRLDGLVNTITTLKDELIDTNKETIYPVVNCEYIKTDIQDDVILVSYSIKVLDQLDIYTTTTDSKLLTDTNEQDVMNETFLICQTFINSFRKYNNFNIEIVSVTDLMPVKNENLNGLSGHEFDIVLSTLNIGSACQ